MRQAQCSVARSNDWVGRTLKMFLRECHWFNGPHNKPVTDPESDEVDPCYNHVQLWVLSGNSGRIAALQLNSGHASLTPVMVTQIYLH